MYSMVTYLSSPGHDAGESYVDRDALGDEIHREESVHLGN